jgi:hypothetical protein
MASRHYIRGIPQADVRRIMDVLRTDSRYSRYRDWIPSDGLIGPSGLAALEALAAGRDVPDRVNVFMSAADLNTRFRTLLQQDRFLELLERTDTTLPHSVTGIEPNEQLRAREVRTQLGLPRGLGMPSREEMLGRVNAMLSEIDEKYKDAPPELSIGVARQRLMTDINGLRDALGDRNPTRISAALERVGNLSTRVSEHLQGLSGEAAQTLRRTFGLEGGATPLTTAEAGTRVTDLMARVRALGPTVTVEGQSVEMDTAIDIPGASGTTRETPRENLLRRLQELQTALQQPGASVAAALNRDQDRYPLLQRDLPTVFGGRLPPPEGGAATVPSSGPGTSFPRPN